MRQWIESPDGDEVILGRPPVDEAWLAVAVAWAAAMAGLVALLLRARRGRG